MKYFGFPAVLRSHSLRASPSTYLRLPLLQAAADGAAGSPQFALVRPQQFCADQAVVEGVEAVLGTDVPVVGLSTLCGFSSVQGPAFGSRRREYALSSPPISSSLHFET